MEQIRGAADLLDLDGIAGLVEKAGSEAPEPTPERPEE